MAETIVSGPESCLVRTPTIKRVWSLIKRANRGCNKAIIHLALPFFVRTHAAGLELEFVGSDYGGWTIPVNLIRRDWVCYCVGVGADATFDLALAERFGCRVYSFDPTPKAQAYIAELQRHSQTITFVPVGVWSEDTELEFFAPAKSTDTSHSVFDLHARGAGFRAVCKRLVTIMAELAHDRIDLLKLDVEGAWEEILADLLSSRIPVRVLCVEFDSPVTLRRVLRTVRMLREAGFELAHYHKNNYLFVAQAACRAD